MPEVKKKGKKTERRKRITKKEFPNLLKNLSKTKKKKPSNLFSRRNEVNFN